MEAAFPGVIVGVHFVDFFEGAFLDLLAVGRGEVGYAHYQVTRNGVETCGYHGEADGHHFCVVEFGLGVLEHVTGDAGFVGTFGYAFLKHVEQLMPGVALALASP